MIGFGTKSDTSINILQDALDNKYNFFDFKDSDKSISHIKNLNFN